jgi:excisionase family DNA binding protein
MRNPRGLEMTTAEVFEQGSVTVAGLKAEYGIGRSTAYELMGAGRLPYTQVGRRRLIPRRAVMQLLAAGLVGGERSTAAMRVVNEEGES